MFKFPEWECYVTLLRWNRFFVCSRIILRSQLKKSHQTNTTTIMTTEMFPPHQCSMIQVNKKRNLIYALNVVKVSRRKVAWKDICILILEANHFLAITAIIHVYRKNISKNTCKLTQVKNNSSIIILLGANYFLAVIVTLNVLGKATWKDTCAHTQGTNHSPVMCVGNHLHKVVI